MRNNKIGSKPGLLFWFIILVFDIVFLVMYGRSHIDSDIASEFILATIKRDFPSMLVTNWCYSTELVVLDMQPLYSFGLLLFPHNWTMARTVGMAIAYLITSITAWSIMRESDLEKYAEWFAGFVLCPISFGYQWQTIYGGEYIWYIIKALIAILAIIKISKAQSKKPIGWWVLLILISLLSGLQGVRQGMVFYVPLIPVACYLYFFKKNKNFFTSSVISSAVYCLGALINHSILSQLFIFVNNEHQMWGKGTGSWMTSFKWYLESYGYCQTTALGVYEKPQNIDVMSFNGISIGFGLIMAAVVLASMIYCIVKFKKLSEYEQAIVGLTFSMIFVNCFVFTYLCPGRNYWEPTIPFGYIFILVTIKHIDEFKTNYKRIIVSAVAVMALICSLGTCNLFLTDSMYSEPGLEQAVDYILDNTDYRAGYGYFWLANKAQFMSNGEIEMYNTSTLPYEIELNYWLQRLDHFETAPQSHYFILVRSGDVVEGEDTVISRTGADCIYDDGSYCIYAVD